ncbi:MAG: hypothetical protein UAT33_01480 [Buchnera aphidicola (Floraphis choui)]
MTKYYKICISNNGIIRKIEFIERTGIKNVIISYNQNFRRFKNDQFVFKSILV